MIIENIADIHFGKTGKEEEKYIFVPAKETEETEKSGE